MPKQIKILLTSMEMGDSVVVVTDSTSQVDVSGSAVASSVDLKTPADMMLKVIVDAIQKKPETGTEALALFSYIMERDIGPLIAKLKTWVIAELKKEEGVLVQKALDKFKKLEAMVEAKCGCLQM